MGSGSNTCPQHPVAVEGETNLFAVSFVGKLDLGELLTGTPTVVEVTTSDLTIANKAVSTAELEIDDITVAIGRAVQFTVTGQQTGTTYTLKITCGTDASQTKILYCTFPTEDE